MRGDKASLLVSLLDDELPGDSQWDTMERWKMDKEIEVSSSNRIREIDEQIEVLLKAKAIALQSKENLKTEISQKEAERNEFELTLLQAVAFKKVEQIKGLQERNHELEDLLEEQEDLKIVMQQYLSIKQQELAEANELVSQLVDQEEREKKLMKLARRKDLAGRTRLIQAHRLECDALRLQLHLQQAAGHHEPFSTEAAPEAAPSNCLNEGSGQPAVKQETQESLQAGIIMTRATTSRTSLPMFQ